MPYLSKMPILSIYIKVLGLAWQIENELWVGELICGIEYPKNVQRLGFCSSRLGRWHECTYLHSQVQGRLASESQHDSIRPFFLNDVSHILGCDGKVVDFICQLMIRLYGGNIGIDEDRGHILLF